MQYEDENYSLVQSSLDIMSNNCKSYFFYVRPLNFMDDCHIIVKTIV